MAELLPPAAWTKRADLAALIAALGAENVRYVGGAVRDTLLGLAVKDIDMATLLRPEAVIARCTGAGIKTVPTGLAHGTVTAILAQGPVEITTLRHDLSTDGRRAVVAFGVAFAGDWQADAARRDFTINALYADPASGEIADYFGGLVDLAARRVRFIGDATARIHEDHLRILRYFRFQARFGAMPADAVSEQACADLAATLKGLSRERVGMEMLALLALPDPAPTVARMAELGVLALVLPEADAAGLAELVAQEARQAVAPEAIRRLAALLPADVAVAEAVAARFRLSTAQKKRLAVAAAAAGRGSADPLRSLAYRLGMDQALDRALLTGRDIAPLRGWTVPRFPLKGGQIVASGVTAGPEVARILRAIEDQWVLEGYPGEERIEALLREFLKR